MSWGHLGGSWGSLRELLGRLGVVLGGLGALLGGSWEGLGRSCGDLKATVGAVNFLIVFLIDFDRFWSPKGCPKGGIWRAKMGPKTIPKRGRNLRAKKLRLGSDLGRFGVVLGGSPGGIFINFVLVFLLFREHLRFRC